MKISIEVTGKEIADLILQLQGQQEDMTNELIKEFINRMSKRLEKGGVIPLGI